MAQEGANKGSDIKANIKTSRSNTTVSRGIDELPPTGVGLLKVERVLETIPAVVVISTCSQKMLNDVK